MAVIRVEETGDARLDPYRNVPDRDLLATAGLFVAEGRLVVRRVIESRRFAVRSVMVTETALAALEDLLDTADELPVYVVPQSVMNDITGFNIHRGCLALGERPRPCAWPDLAIGARRLIALEGIANADNVGSIFRSASAFGVDAVLLDDRSTDPLYRKAIRTSMGAALDVPFARAEPLPEALRELGSVGPVLSASAKATADRRSSKSEGWSDGPWVVLALTPSLDAPPLGEIAPAISARPVVVVVGHEGDGLSAGTLDACTHYARIPMQAGVDSLNVAVAAAIALYELSH